MRSLSDAPEGGRNKKYAQVCFPVHMKSVFRQPYNAMVLLILSGAMALFIACANQHLQHHGNPPPVSDYSAGTLDFLQIDGSVVASITVEIADTPEIQMKGLMGRKKLDLNKGMLFVFKQIKPRTFWMKDTPISLDIIFIGGDGCVLNIAESTRPMSVQNYPSDGPVKYVVEVRAGFAKRFKINSNTCIRWHRL